MQAVTDFQFHPTFEKVAHLLTFMDEKMSAEFITGGNLYQVGFGVGIEVRRRQSVAQDIPLGQIGQSDRGPAADTYLDMRRRMCLA